MRQFLPLLVLLPLLQRQDSAAPAVQSRFPGSGSLLPSALVAEATRARHRASTLAADDEETPDDEDTVLSEQEQEAEDECEAQAVVQKMLQAELDGSSTSLMAASPQWKHLKASLEKHMDNKEMCAPLSGSQPVCRQVQKADDTEVVGSATTELKCGGAEYEKLIEKYVHEKNCLAAVVFSHVLAQTWLGHTDPSKASGGGSEVARKGIIDVLVSQYKKAMDSGFLDDTLWYIYQDTATLLENFKSAATQGLNAFNSDAVRKALLRRRETQTAIFCSAGNGGDAHLGANVIVNDGALIFRVNLDGEDGVAVDAFTEAIRTFATTFVQAVLEEGGLLDRAIELHKRFYKFRFFKIQGLMQNAEPSADVREQNKLMNALPMEKHRKTKHAKTPTESASFLQVTSGVKVDPQQLQPVAPISVPTQLAPQMPTPVSPLPLAVVPPTPAVISTTQAVGAPDPYLSSVPMATAVTDMMQPVAAIAPAAPVAPQQLSEVPQSLPLPQMPQPQAPSVQGLAAPTQLTPLPEANTAAVAQPAVTFPTAATTGQTLFTPSEQTPTMPGLQEPMPGLQRPMSGVQGSMPAIAPSTHMEPPLSPLEVYEQGAQHQPLEQHPEVSEPVQSNPEKPPTQEEVPAKQIESRPQTTEQKRKYSGALSALGALDARGHLPEMTYNAAKISLQPVKAVPIKQKVQAIFSRLRMFKMNNETVLYEPDTEIIEKTVKAAYLDTTDRVFDVWGALLPQAATTTTAQLLTLLLPKPDVDLAEFYNKTMNSEGVISDGLQSQLPVNHTRLVERFALFLEEVYRDCWRNFFNVNDNFLSSSSSSETGEKATLSAASIPTVSAVQLSDAKVVDLADGVVRRGLEKAASMEAVVKGHSFVSLKSSTTEKGIDIAIVDSSDGVGVNELAKVFTDEKLIQELTEKALSSGASTLWASAGTLAVAGLVAVTAL
ncbi:hypothetical protein TGVEG_243930 [Toxoplasma gondii VEG]|uniref:Uncharacterized protein n=1 Tax=Toxoplasma gondii (strain ATCC 50861 / VEG) TaxID=432359 RepID=V5B7N3_TOXGV|nr:hypothetical protein TGVEG_243930 [Toxoplasma gondii VEG]CEL73174.1 TPA: hypothetical protein BN1205_103660 [Toxoplasma gondii VEG]